MALVPGAPPARPVLVAAGPLAPDEPPDEPEAEEPPEEPPAEPAGPHGLPPHCRSAHQPASPVTKVWNWSTNSASSASRC